jgi:hypothetical protein
MTDVWGNNAEKPTIAWHCEYCEVPSMLTILERWWVLPDGDEEFDPFE